LSAWWQALGVADDDTVLQVGFWNEAAIKRVLPLLTQGRLAGIEARSGQGEAGQRPVAGSLPQF